MNYARSVCESGVHRCDQNCHEWTSEFYTCSCNEGYMLNFDGFTCEGEINLFDFRMNL